MPLNHDTNWPIELCMLYAVASQHWIERSASSLMSLRRDVRTREFSVLLVQFACISRSLYAFATLGKIRFAFEIYNMKVLVENKRWNLYTFWLRVLNACGIRLVWMGFIAYSNNTGHFNRKCWTPAWIVHDFNHIKTSWQVQINWYVCGRRVKGLHKYPWRFEEKKERVAETLQNC